MAEDLDRKSVYDVDMERIKKLADRPYDGTWQDLFRGILDGNNLR